MLPSMIITFSTTESVCDQYQLRGIIYCGQLHFTAQLIMKDNMVWGYDGQYNMGIPFEDQKDADDEHKLVIFQGQHAHIYIYQLI